VDHLIDRIPLRFEIYEEGDISIVNLNKLKKYVQETTGIEIFLRGNIYENISMDQVQTIAQKMAQLRIKDPEKEFLNKTPLKGEVTYEEERISDQKWKSFGILYEGILYQKHLADFPLKKKLNERYCSILITNQLVGTWDQNDHRYHIRTSIYGSPHIISVPGLVLAPAKPREFYIKRQMGVPVEILKEEYKGRFLEHGDLRTTEILKGYLIQALFYDLIGNPFCDDSDCRLFNSHWQEEMLHAQLDGKYEFCSKHEALLKKIRNTNKEVQSLKMV